jgi:hypothetical protein
MGGDGGSFSQRTEMVKLKKKVGKATDAATEALNRWHMCRMSGEPLRRPIVACELGNLYNKSSVLTHLLNLKSNRESEAATAFEFSHIRSLKNVCELKLLYDDETKLEGQDRVFFTCPITGIPANGRRFVMMRACGCVLSEKALKQIPSTTCLVCARKLEKPITFNDDDSANSNNGNNSNSSSSSHQDNKNTANEAKEEQDGKKKKVMFDVKEMLTREYIPLNSESPEEFDALRAVMNEKRNAAKADKKKTKGKTSENADKMKMEVDNTEFKVPSSSNSNNISSSSTDGTSKKRHRDDNKPGADKHDKHDRHAKKLKTDKAATAKPSLLTKKETAPNKYTNSDVFKSLFRSKDAKPEPLNFCGSKPMTPMAYML